jgi:hypothetical protein
MIFEVSWFSVIWKTGLVELVGKKSIILKAQFIVGLLNSTSAVPHLYCRDFRAAQGRIYVTLPDRWYRISLRDCNRSFNMSRTPKPWYWDESKVCYATVEGVWHRLCTTERGAQQALKQRLTKPRRRRVYSLKW